MTELFKVEHGSVTPSQARISADDLEKALGEIANGKRKAGKLPMEPLIALIQFVRNTLHESKK